MRSLAALTMSIALIGLGYGCSSSSSDEPTYAFKDVAGRQCTVKRFPPKATCDQPANKACAAGSAPCFVVSTGQLTQEDGGVGGPRVVRNCASCCSGESSSSMTSDCVPVVCTTDSDCAGEPASCVAGRCEAH